MEPTVHPSETLKLNDFDNDENVSKRSYFKQYYATFCLDLLAVIHGLFCGWPSAATLILKSDETPLKSGPVNSLEASWIASIMCIGGFIGNILFGWVAQRIGKKKTLIIVTFPLFACWTLVYLADNLTLLMISRFLGGLAGGGFFALAPSYISEIADDAVRGTLGSSLVFSCNFGIFLAYVLGEYVEYLTFPWFVIPIVSMFFLLFIRIPDSPSSLAKRGIYNEAEKSLIYFRNVKHLTKFHHQQILDDLKKLESTDADCDNKITLDDFKRARVRKALIYGICLMALNQFAGVFAMLNFTASIFEESGSSLKPNVASILVGGIQIIGSMFPMFLVDRLGRKAMMVVSAVGSSLGLFSHGVFALLKAKEYEVENFNWIPVVALSFTIFIANWGVLTLPFMILSEISETRIRGFVTVTCMSFLWIFAFIAIKFLTLLIEVLGMHGAMFVFSINALIGAFFVWICLPETKGKSFDEIAALLERRRR